MASIRRHPKSGRWQVRYRDPDGRQRSRTFARKVDARKYVSTVAADVLRGEFVDPVAGRTTCHRFEYSPKGEWVATLDRAAATRGKALRIVFNVFELARGDEALKVNPAADVKPPKVSRQRTGRALTDDEMTALREAAEAVDVRTAAMVWVMAGCGLRVGEVIALKRGDVDFDQGLLSVSGSMSRRAGVTAPKTEAGIRTIPIPSDVAGRLRRHLAEQTVADLGGFVFTAPRGGRCATTIGAQGRGDASWSPPGSVKFTPTTYGIRRRLGCSL